MATDLETRTELEAFHDYVGKLLRQGKRKMTLEESLADFREYQKEAERLRAEIQPALERSLRGESKPFDPEDIIRRGNERLAEKGITRFREYQEEVQRLREELQPAIERADREEGREIDAEEIKRRGRERLAREGITD